VSKTALIVGSTGLIGNKLSELLLEDSSYKQVVSVTRREESHSNSKFKNLVVDFDQLEEFAAELKADDVFCCLGTTMKKAGSKEKFKKVDYQYPLEVAQITKNNGATGYFLVSAMGANPSSSFFYNQVKGEVEQAISKLDFQSYHIFRPALLFGERNESRTGERIAQFLFKLFKVILIGPFKKYRGIKYEKVSRAMLTYARSGEKGEHIHESLELQKY